MCFGQCHNVLKKFKNVIHVSTNSLVGSASGVPSSSPSSRTFPNPVFVSWVMYGPILIKGQENKSKKKKKKNSYMQWLEYTFHMIYEMS